MLSVPGAKAVRGYSFFGDSLRLHPVRGRHRPVLGALARARVPEPGAVAAARRRASRRSGRMRPAWAGSTSTRWWTAAARTTWRSCARCRTGSCSFELKTVPDVAEVATRRRHGASSTRSCSTPTSWRAYSIPQAQVIEAIAQRQPGGRRLGARTRRGRVHGARHAATCKTLDDFRSDPADDHRRRRRRCGWATSRASRSGPRCAAASPNWTARARWPAASS